MIIVGHGNLMRAATGAYTDEGGSGIYAPRPESGKGFELVALLSPEDWTRLKPSDTAPTADRRGIGRLERAQRKAAPGIPHRSFVLSPPMAASSIGVAKDGAEYFAGPEFMRSEGGETSDGKAILSHML